jgi:hypothetical protein
LSGALIAANNLSDLTSASTARTNLGLGTGNSPTFTGVITGAGTVSAPAITTTGDTNTGIFFPAADTIAFTEGGVESMRIDNTGNVCVGSTAAGNAGAINVSVGSAGTTSGGLQLWASTTQTHVVQWGDGTTGSDPYRGYIEYAHNGDSMRFGTAATERIRITSSGGVGIGTSSPVGQVDISGSQSNISLRMIPTAEVANVGDVRTLSLRRIATDSVLGIGYATTPDAWFISASYGSTGAYKPIAFATSDTERMRIDSSGNVGIGNTSPAGKLHVMKTATGGSPQNAAGNQIVIENGDSSGSADLQFLSANNGYNHLFFGDAADANVGTFLYDHNDNSMQFITNASEKMRLTSAGNLGIGITNPGAKLVVIGSGNLVRFGDGTNTFDVRFSGPNNWAQQLDTSADQFNIQRNSTNLVSITSGANLQFNSGYGSVATAYGVRAWARFNGLAATINASGGVTSITRSGVGVYTINLSFTMPDANYAPLSGDYSYGGGWDDTLTTTSWTTKRIGGTWGSLVDVDQVFVAAIR